MIWFQLILGAISLAREVLKYISEQERFKHEKYRKMVALKNGFKKARKERDTSGLESAFAELGFSLPVATDGETEAVDTEGLYDSEGAMSDNEG